MSLGTKKAGFAIGLLSAALTAGSAFGVPREVYRGVPGDSVASYFVGGPRETPKDPGNGSNPSALATGDAAQNSLAMADFWIRHAQDLGLFSSLDETCRAWLDGMGMALVILRYPHAVALMDLEAYSLPDGHHAVRQLRAAIIVRTKGKNEEIEGRIQHLLSEYTNREESALSTDTTDGRRVTTLRDRRLLDWAIFKWGPIGDDYVMALGDGAFERVEAALKDEKKSIAHEAWFQAATAKLDAAGSDFFGVANLDALRRGCDAGLWKRIVAAGRELHVDGVTQGAIAVTMKNRDVDVTALLRRDQENSILPLTIRASDRSKLIASQVIPPRAPTPLSPSGGEGRVRGAGEDSWKDLVSKTVPPEATWNLVLDIAPHEWMTAIVNAYLVGRRPDARRQMQEEWAQLESEAGISIEKDIFAPMGRGIISFDFPKHALRLPLAWTRLIRISGDPAKLRESIDKLFGVWRQRLGETNPLQLRHADDGVWFLYFGLEGPALKVEDQWIVVSFSPEAVRENVKYISARTSIGMEQRVDPASR